MLKSKNKLYCLKPICLLKFMKYGQKCVGKNGKIGLKFFAGKCWNFFFIGR